MHIARITNILVTRITIEDDTIVFIIMELIRTQVR